MSFLSWRKKKTEEKAPAPVPARKLFVAPAGIPKPEPAPTRAYSHRGARDAILRPRVTEKASSVSERGAYVFDVSLRANKREISEEIRALYNVVPVKVSTVRIPSKVITVKGKTGVRSGGKKAYVYLPPGQKLDNL